MRGAALLVLLLTACAREPNPEPRAVTAELGASTASPAPTPPPAMAPEDILQPNRPLTPGEIALLRPLFRDGIDYAAVRIIHGKFLFQPDGVYMTPRGHVYAPGALHLDDFSKGSADDRAIFVHELVHVWQHARGMDLVAEALEELARHDGDYERAYPYHLERGRDLAAYGMEQQAAILEDYYTLTVLGGAPRWLTNRGLSTRQRAALYAETLHKFLGDARYAAR